MSFYKLKAIVLLVFFFSKTHCQFALNTDKNLVFLTEYEKAVKL